MPDWLYSLPHPEWLLLASMAGLYGYEAVCLLHPTELLLVPGARGWRCETGSRHFQLGGRHVQVPVASRFFRPAFRLRWRPEGGATPLPAWPDPRMLHVLHRLGLPVIAMTLALLVCASGILLGQIDQAACGLVIFYALALGALAYVWRARHVLGLGGRQVCALGVEILCCPPFAINLVRRLSLAHSPGHDGLALALRLLGPEEWHALAATAGEVQQFVLDFGEMSPAQRQAAVSLRMFLQGECP